MAEPGTSAERTQRFNLVTDIFAVGAKIRFGEDDES